jgi:putative transposase
MKINFAYRYELKPNASQKILLAKSAGAARFAYNWGLGLRIELYEREKKSTNAIEQHKLLNNLKSTHFPWMYEVSKCAPQEALRDLDRAFQNFFRGCKNLDRVGFPKFKKKSYQESFRLTGAIKLKNKKIQLPRLGSILLKEKSKVEGKILSATVNREADRWYVSLTIEKEISTPEPVKGEIVGIDVGLDHFASLSDEQKIVAPKPLNKKIKRLKRLSKQHSRKIKGSNNRKKSALKLARRHRKIRNIRKDFLHQFSTKLAKTKSVIIVENLDIKKMMQVSHQLNQSIHDAGWGEFKRMLTYKTLWYGSKLVLAPRYYPSSKLCSKCEFCLDKLPLSIRNWHCPCCHASHDRDINAAKNLRNYYTGSSPGIYACGDSSDGGTGNWSTNHESLKQELISGIFVHKL